MSATSHRAVKAPEGAQVPTFARLYRTEMHRLRARRFIRWTVLIGLVAYIALFAVLWIRHSRSDAADLAQASAQRDRQLAEFQAEYRDCLKQAPADQAEDRCGVEPTADGFTPDEYLKKHPYRPGQVDGDALAVGGGVALLGFVIAATFIGAEWSSKNLTAWLFFEPRRLRLMAAKLLALLSVTLALAALAQLGWAVGVRILLHHRGLPVSSLGPDAKGFWAEVARVQVRAALLVVATTLLGFGLANLIRNTAAAFGVSFVYFAVIESLLRGLNPKLQPYLFTDSLGAWVSKGGVTVFGDERYDPKFGGYIAEPIHISNLHGGVTLLVYAGVVTVVSTWLFRRRDIS
jgi:ABC-2 type transport system permease protein